jgi:LPS export ABC transporter protein LptC
MAITMDAREAPRDRVRKGAGQTADRARAFRRARRHSLLVKILRVAMPVGAAGIVGFYALTLGISWQMGSGRIKVGEIQLTPDDLTMKNATYFGQTKEGGRYEVRAKKAILELNKDAPIKLIDIDGDLLQANDVTTKLRAKHGLLDNAKSELELFDGIEIDASNGMKARMSRAMVYSKEHRIVSKHPVDLTMPTGRIRGATMTMRSDTREATFVGDVKAHLVSAEQPGQATPSTPAFGRDNKQPVDVTSEQLYVNDLAKTALFMGKVVAVQGDSTLKAPELHITYEGRAAAEALTASAQPQQPEDASRLSRLVAKNGVVVTIGTDRRVSSDQVDFDAKADTALFVGDVQVNQQKNVLHGARLFIDRKAATSHLETPADGAQPAGRIAATFFQNSAKGAAQPKAKAKSAADNRPTVQDGVMGSFKSDPNAPMDIEADMLDVYDNEKRAVFHGNVKSKQGDFTVRTVEMIAFYSGQAGLGLSSSGDEAANKTPSELTRVEAKQKVLMTSKDGQSATGDWAIFDIKANTVLLGDDVTISRGKDVAQGPRLKIDLTTGMYRFELEQEPAVAPVGPASSASLPLTAPPPASNNPAERACAPGRQCLLVYPKEAQERAKGAVDKVLPGSSAARTGDAWQPSTSASPTLRGD